MAAEKGNKYTQKYSEKDALKLFLKAVEFARTSEDCLSVQDAIIHIDIPHTTFYDLCKKHKGLNNIKKEINNLVIARINRGSLKNKLNSTASIWRMKQLGESDKQEVIQHNINSEIDLSEEEIQNELNRLRGAE